MRDTPPYAPVDALRHTAGSSLEVILKVTERCNIACTYCYFFFAGNDSHAEHPSLLKRDGFLETVDFLAKALEEHQLDRIQIDFHGGEPLLVKPEYFAWMCETLQERLGACPQLILAVQTNAMLVNDTWIELFGRFNIQVGVSIDGPSEYNDRFRVDHKGRGTHAKVVEGIRALQAAHARGVMDDLGVLCVINPDFDITRVYRHIVDELGVRNLNFLLPDVAGSTYGPGAAKAMIPILRELTALWLADTSVNLTFLRKPFQRFLAGGRYDEEMARFRQLKAPILTIYSNGEIGPDDAIRPLAPELFVTGLNVATSSLTDVMTHPDLVAHVHRSFSLPKDCEACCWRNMCRGGELSHRPTADGGFAARSAYCEALSDMYAELAAAAINQGARLDSVAGVLGLRPDELGEEPAAAPSPAMLQTVAS
ncbi:radical SAM protein [Caulobacter sp.]|uniref:radical SAM protein n=1 Tax=Caulobacter sp. TaxID=78 RepID=UPI001B190C22|nr:radical SAM protein [Caulobacter sp.]MBO9545877.1 radical SAM protein [Caulobacter sp.]